MSNSEPTSPVKSPSISNRSDFFTDLVPHPDVLNPDEDVYVPENLRAGSIIGCHIPTFIKDENQMRPNFRQALVLGMKVDPETYSYSGLFVLPLTSSLKHNDESAFLLNRQQERNGDITGINVPSAIPYDNIHFVPLTIRYFNYWSIQMMGSVSEDLFKDIANGLNSFNGRVDQKVLNQRMIDGFHMTLMAPHQVDYQSDLPDFIPSSEFSIIDEDMKSSYLTAAAVRRLNAIPGEEVAVFVKDIKKSQRRTYRKQHRLAHLNNRLFSLRDSFARDSDRHKSLVKLREQAQEELSDALEDEHIEPSKRQKYEYVLELLDAIAAGGSLQEKFEEAQKASRTIELPKFLWQGRYISMNIVDLKDERAQGNAFRPVALWALWEDKDTGRIMAVEGYPCSRSQSSAFDYTLRANPLYTKSLKPGYLIADCLVRLAFKPRHIQDSVDAEFNELPNDKFEKFAERVRRAEEFGATKVFGIQNIPDNWVRRELLDRPDEKWFLKQVKRGNLSLDDRHLDRFRARQDRHQSRKKESLEFQGAVIG